MSIDGFFNILEKFLEEHNFSRKQIIAGDFNIDLLRDNQEYRGLSDIFTSFGMNLLSQRSQSRETSTSASCIDHIWGNVLRKRAKNYSIGPADNCLCECVLMLPKLLKENERSFFTRNLKVFINLDNRLRLEFLMSQKVRNIAFSDTDTNTAIVKLNEVITYCFDRFCPLTKIKRARKNGVTNQVLRASSKKRMSSTKYILKIRQ